MRHHAICSLSVAFLLVLSASAPGQPTTQRFPGDVVALNGRHIELRSGSGEVVTFDETVPVVMIEPGDASMPVPDATRDASSARDVAARDSSASSGAGHDGIVAVGGVFAG